jgi:BirA family biotin operon repressor/biotin-[acetyl-CoA-carboxylase] ligase
MVETVAAFDLKRIAAETFVAEIAYRPEVASTNDWALELARAGGHRLPLLVLASQQTQGRGRGTNRWWSAPGALTFSLLLDSTTVLPDVHALPQISVVAALAVCEALASLAPGQAIGLKWPNDLLLGRRKLCGILVESPARPPNRLVTGIGINVNNSFAEASVDVRQRAASWAEATGRPWALTDVLIRVLRSLDQRMASFQAGRLRLSEACRPWCVLTGRAVTVAAGRDRIEGVCAGIGDDGALLVTAQAAPQRLFSGVVEAIAWDDAAFRAAPWPAAASCRG